MQTLWQKSVAGNFLWPNELDTTQLPTLTDATNIMFLSATFWFHQKRIDILWLLHPANNHWIDCRFINLNIVCTFCVKSFVVLLPIARIDSIISDDNKIVHVNTNIVMSSFKHWWTGTCLVSLKGLEISTTPVNYFTAHIYLHWTAEGKQVNVTLLAMLFSQIVILWCEGCLKLQVHYAEANSKSTSITNEFLKYFVHYSYRVLGEGWWGRGWYHKCISFALPSYNVNTSLVHKR